MIASIVDHILFDRRNDNFDAGPHVPIDIAVRNCDEPLPLGHVFTEIVTFGPNTRDYDRPLPVKSTTPCKLHVIRIQWYGYSIHALDPGHTSALSIQGEGIDELREALKEAQPQHVYSVSLRSPLCSLCLHTQHEGLTDEERSCKSCRCYMP